MFCPHCGVATSYAAVERSKYVQTSRGQFVRAEVVSGSIYEDRSNFWFGLSRCQACGKAFPVRGETRNPDNPDHPDRIFRGTVEPLWPTQFRVVPEEIPSPVREAMMDASKALGAGSVIGSLLATRTAMIRAQRQQKEERNLKEASLQALFDEGIISKFEFEASDLARRWANYLGHEEFDLEKQFERTEAEEFYGYVENLLDTIYVKWARLEQARTKLKGEKST